MLIQFFFAYQAVDLGDELLKDVAIGTLTLDSIQRTAAGTDASVRATLAFGSTG